MTMPCSSENQTQPNHLPTMKSNHKFRLLLLAIPILGVIGYAAWKTSPSPSARSGARKVALYQDSMHPWIKSAHPGKCTICAMDLTPICEGQKGFGLSDDLVVLSSNSITVLHVQGEEVKRQPLGCTLRVAGTLDPIETRKAVVSAPAPCRIQALAVEYAGVEVKEGQTLITLFSPELVQKRSYLRALGAVQADMGTNLMPATTKADPYSSSLVAPLSGIVVERNVSQGQYVPEGEKLLTIVDSSVLWFRFDVYQRQLPWFKLGQSIEVVVEGLPGKVLTAVISFLDPTLNDAARTVKVRADIKNPVVATNGHPQRLLRFGMYAEGRVRSEIPNVLAVPRTAILFPGGSAYAYVDKGDGAYERRRVLLGRQGDELWEILEGLEEGDRVITSGNVLIDAQAQFNQGGRSDSAGAEMLTSGNEVKASPDPQPAPSAKETASVEATTTKSAAGPDRTRTSTNKALTHREADVNRMAVRDQLRLMRAAAIAEANRQKTAAAIPPTGNQPQAMAAFLKVADDISQALAADDLGKANQCITNLPGVLSSLQKELGASHRWSGLIQTLVGLKWPPAKDLADARKQFLPFSTAAVELVKHARKEEPTLASLKVYHCPMAPKPGLWMQAKGPLRNPFYGSEMLECGREVKP